MYTEESPYLEMVTLSSYERHILDLWYECGTVAQGAGGLLPLDWDVIITWANHFYQHSFVEWVEHPRASNRHKRIYTPLMVTECTLMDWELELIRRLSQEYSSEYACASEPSRPCPKVIELDDVTEDEKLANAKAIAEGFKLLFGKKDDKSVEVVQNK